MLDSIVVVWFSGSPVGVVKGFSKVVSHPGPVVEDVRQADPEAIVGVAIPTSSSDLVHQSVLLLFRVDLNQKTTALLAFPPRLIPGGVPVLEEIAAGVK